MHESCSFTHYQSEQNLSCKKLEEAGNGNRTVSGLNSYEAGALKLIIKLIACDNMFEVLRDREVKREHYPRLSSCMSLENFSPYPKPTLLYTSLLTPQQKLSSHKII